MRGLSFKSCKLIGFFRTGLRISQIAVTLFRKLPKSSQPTCLPRGRLRRKRRATTETVHRSHWGSQKWSSSVPVLAQEASFWTTFQRTCGVQLHRPGPKSRCKKKADIRQTSDKIRPIWSSPETCFRTLKTQIPPAKVLKTSPKSKTQILLTSRLIGTSGFSSVVGTLLKLRLRRNNWVVRSQVFWQ